MTTALDRAIAETEAAEERNNSGLRVALKAANELIGEAADEAKRLQDQIDELEAKAR